MIRFSANLGFLWPDRPLLERIEAAARAGFQAVELHWPYDVPAADVRAAVAEHGLVLLGINTVRGDVAGGENGLGALPGREAEARAAIDQALDYCAAAGGTAVHCMAGYVAPADRAAGRESFVRTLGYGAEKAAALGLTLLLEPLNPRDAPGYFYSTTGEALAVIEAVDADNLRLMFDCYHVGVTEGDVLSRLQACYPAIGHVQIASVPARAEPDTGALDYPGVFAVLERLGYAGWVGAEYKPRGDTDAGMGWLRSFTATPS